MSSDYVALIERQIQREVDDLTTSLLMPAWSRATYRLESAYNATTATRKRWLDQDSQLVRYGRQSVEPCDLLTPQADFIHVKEVSKSQVFSVVIGQALAAAYLLKHDETFRTEMHSRFAAFTGGGDLGHHRPRFVLAIARSGTASVFGRMLGPKIGVLNLCRRVHALGYGFGVCRVQLT